MKRKLMQKEIQQQECDRKCNGQEKQIQLGIAKENRKGKEAFENAKGNEQECKRKC